MEVINGNFGGPQEADILLLEALTEGVKKAGWEDKVGAKFFLIMDSEEQMSFVTNEPHPADVVMMLEVVKHAIVGNQ